MANQNPKDDPDAPIRNPVTAFLLWCSKTDERVLRACGKNNRWLKWTHQARGAFVLFAASLAFVAAYYTLRTTVASSQAGAIAGAVWFGTFVFMIDRELVGHWFRRGLWVRLLFSAFLSTLVAIPAELKMLQGRIDQQLQRNHASENSEAHHRQVSRQSAIDKQQAEIEKQILVLQGEEQDTARNREAEEVGRVILGQTTGLSGRGPAYRAAADRLAVLSQQRKDLEAQLHRLDTERGRVDDDFEHEKISGVYDFPSRYEALSTAAPMFSPMWRLSWLWTIIFFLIDMTPVLMKVIFPATVYDHVIRAEAKEVLARVEKIAEYNEQEASRDFLSPQPSTTELLEKVFGTGEAEHTIR